ncbi:hypothetical protein MIZ01_0392 [Sideroxyarcus emersonii]|uniref:Diguanylate cyclase n=1 Tax=Sideroxyarcus emersonii TaxID=2764705 RepID=A0AAN1X8T6_9PROT|nr:sensor domain-containing diguanylate cyclase [Sideroxyarcus emersonii]BCK86628.1 hypothetical protein MIZ01_0392 [Sideroxyarcus emersonii]
MRVAYKNAFAFLLVIVAYVTSGKAALMLALPPGYAAAIFPPAGIALAATFIIGNSALPSIFLGSFLLNVWVAYSASHTITAISLIVALVIAVASLLQAALGGWLLRRAIGYPAAFDRTRDVFKFLFLTPLVCVMSASVSVAGLWALGILDVDSLAENWLSWWTGDSLGIMVLLPIAMVLFGEPRPLWKRRLWTVAVPMGLVFALFVLLFLRANQWEQDDSLREFRQISEQSLSQIQIKLDEQDAVLAGMRGLFVHDPHSYVSRQEFQRFAQNILTRFPMIQAFEWAPRIDSYRRPGFEAAERKAIRGFEIRDRAANGHMVRAAERSLYFPVTYVEPLEGNQPALGFDLASTPQRLETLEKSFVKGVVSASAPIILVQAENQSGILIMQSVQLTGHEIGVVLTVLKVRDFIDRILPPASGLLHVRLIDDDARSTIYDNFASLPPKIPFEREFEFGGRHYRLQTMPTAAYLKRHRGWQSWAVLAMGTFGVGLLGALLLLGTGYTARVEAQVQHRTRELKESEFRLKELFKNLNSGVAVFQVSPEDNDFIITDLNYAAERIDKVSRKDMIGKSVVDVFPGIREFGLFDVLKRVWKSGAAEHHPVSFYLDGRIAGWRENYVYKLPNGEIIAIYDDVTQAKQLEEQMRRMAHYDTLTGLPNRALFTDRLQQSLAIARRNKSQLAVMFIDLDHFKPVNDTLGHDVGDLLLKEVAVRMLRCVREVDTISRIGGDEFIVLLSGMGKEQDVMMVAEKILYSLDQPFELAGHEIHISSSIGIALYPAHGDEDKSLLKNADIAMYFAKQSGRNNAKLFQPEMLKGDR